MPNVVYLAKALEGRAEGRDWKCICPVHGGHHFVITDKRGHFQMVCMMGAKQDELKAALAERGLWDSPNGNGSTPPQTRPEPRQRTPKEPTALYHYRDPATGKVVATKGRFVKADGSKTFLWSLDEGATWKGFGDNLSGPALPLYGAELLGSDEIVFFCEGEKAVDAIRDQGGVAVCAYSGSGSKPSDETLSVLAGRTVAIWPDNDQIGRAYAYATYQRLRLIANAYILRDVPGMPEKGDAYDFFQMGGRLDSLVHHASVVDSPQVVIEGEGWLVTLPSEGGAIYLRFDHPTYGRHDLTCDVTVWQKVSGQPEDEFAERLNLLSGSGVETYRRHLNEVFERPKGFWTATLNKAITLVRKAIAEHDPSIRLKDAPERQAEGYLLHPFVLASGPTILFGDGGGGKSYLALHWATQICERVPVLYVDYEADMATMRWRCERLGGVPDELHYWPGKGVPLAEMLPALKAKVAREGIGLVIVDSAIPACGGEPEKADIARGYFSALAMLAVPSLTISHVTKAGEDKYPFGSVMWHNLARLTWNVKAEQEDGVNRVGLFHRKANDDMRMKPKGLEIRFGKEAVTIESADVPTFNRDTGDLASKIRSVLASGKATVGEIAEALDATEASIRTRLHQMRDVFKDTEREPVSGSFYWGLKSKLDTGARVW